MQAGVSKLPSAAHEATVGWYQKPHHRGTQAKVIFSVMLLPKRQGERAWNIQGFTELFLWLATTPFGPRLLV